VSQRREFLEYLLAGVGLTLVRPSGVASKQLTRLVIGSDGDLLAFKPDQLMCATGDRVHLTFVNRARYVSVQHNWVLVAPGMADAVARDALAAGEKAGWVPHSDPRVLAATAQCAKGRSVSVDFVAPAPAEYPFLCTNPGHAEVMHGVLVVTASSHSTTAAQAESHSSTSAKTGLRILASVYADMQRKLAAEQFDRLPHETQEFHEGAEALRDGVARDTQEFREQVDTRLRHSLAAADQVATASKSHDGAQVSSALTALADSMHELNALFPAVVRSEPGATPPPRHD
jgi:azurin